jgi:hypothetical protein
MWDPLTEERKNRKFCKMFIQTTSTSAFKLRNPAVLYFAFSLQRQNMSPPGHLQYDEYKNYV